MARVALLYLNTNPDSAPHWELGNVYNCSATPKAIHQCLQSQVLPTEKDYVLIRHAKYGLPSHSIVSEIISQYYQVWHSGGHSEETPKILNFVHPNWMLGLTPNLNSDATSWKLSLENVLLKVDVLKKIPLDISPFQSLAYAGSYLGYNYIRNGVFIKYCKQLQPQNVSSLPLELPSNTDIEEALFARLSFTSFWNKWCLMRSLMPNPYFKSSFFKSWKQVESIKNPVINPYPHPIKLKEHLRESWIQEEIKKVSVIVPTLYRHPSLKTLLTLFSQHPLKPLEIIIIDQTPKESIPEKFYEAFSHLPIHLIHSDKMGQCISRNKGIEQAKGEYLLFIDDDDEMKESLIPLHLLNLKYFDCDISSGVIYEKNNTSLPTDFSFVRLSDTFPTNNTLIKKSVLKKSGNFDLAFNFGARADHDIGTRIYLQGHKMVLNPEIDLIHNHAPMGGLRTHKARVITFGSSRKKLTHHHIPSPTELYLLLKYHTTGQFTDMLWLQLMGTLRGKGSPVFMMLKIGIGLLYLPKNWYNIQKNLKKAKKLFKKFRNNQAYNPHE